MSRGESCQVAEEEGGGRARFDPLKLYEIRRRSVPVLV